MDEKLTIRVPNEQRMQIEAVIKRDYPKFKTVSSVVRFALNEFLEEQHLQKEA